MSDNVIDHLTAPERFRTQENLAKAVGVSQSTISEKRSLNRLTHDQMRRIIQVAPEYGLAITPADFFPELLTAEAG